MKLRSGAVLVALMVGLPACVPARGESGAGQKVDGGDGSLDDAGDGGSDDGGSGGDDGGCDYVAPTGDMADLPTSHIAYRLSDSFGGHVYRAEGEPGVAPEDVSALLPGTSGEHDAAIGLSRDGRWLGLLTSRFGCGDWECLALVATSPTGATATTGHSIEAGGELVHSNGRPSIGRDAAFVVYSSDGGPHTRDLWLARRSATCGARYDAPILLTAGSSYDTHDLPALTPDEKSVVCDCQTDTTQALCTVALDGSGFQTLITLDQGPDGVGSGTEVHSGDFLPDGTLVFEADWEAEQIWHHGGSGKPTQYAPSFTNDNSPCALPDGRVASLWLERDGNPMGYHELKVMNAVGGYDMLVTDVDVNDIGLSCGR